MLEKFSDVYSRVRPYATLLVAMAYGLLIVFSFVGLLFNKGYLPVVALVITCLMWTSACIVKEAAIAFKIFHVAMSSHESPHNEEE